MPSAVSRRMTSTRMLVRLADEWYHARASPSAGRESGAYFENYCATGSRSGAYDVAMAVGVKIKDSGYQGMSVAPIPTTAPPALSLPPPRSAWWCPLTPQAPTASPGPKPARGARAHRVVSNHYNAPNPRARPRREVSEAASGRAAAGSASSRRGGRRFGGGGHRRAREDAQQQTPISRSTATGNRSRRPERTPSRRWPRRRRTPTPRPGSPHRVTYGGHGRGARLLHPDRDGAHARPSASPSARHRLQGGARRHLRPRR